MAFPMNNNIHWFISCLDKKISSVYRAANRFWKKKYDALERSFNDLKNENVNLLKENSRLRLLNESASIVLESKPILSGGPALNENEPIPTTIKAIPPVTSTAKSPQSNFRKRGSASLNRPLAMNLESKSGAMKRALNLDKEGSTIKRKKDLTNAFSQDNDIVLMDLPNQEYGSPKKNWLSSESSPGSSVPSTVKESRSPKEKAVVSPEKKTSDPAHNTASGRKIEYDDPPYQIDIRKPPKKLVGTQKNGFTRDFDDQMRKLVGEAPNFWKDLKKVNDFRGIPTFRETQFRILSNVAYHKKDMPLDSLRKLAEGISNDSFENLQYTDLIYQYLIEERIAIHQKKLNPYKELLNSLRE